MADQPDRWIHELVDRAYERGQARAIISELGHPVPAPADEDEAYRRRFEDLVYRYVSGKCLGGGPGGNVVRLERRPGPEATDQAAVGGQPAPVPAMEPGQHPTNFETEENA